MAEKKGTIKGLPEDMEKLMVQKSRPLQSLWKSDFSLAEFKILDAYLARIDSHRPENRTVVFERGELESLMGVDRIRKEDLDDRLKHLMVTVRLDDEGKKKGFKRVALFEKAEAETDDDGLWKVEMNCTASAMEYIFSIDDLGYQRYKLRNVVRLNSRYSYLLFLYLEQNRFRKTWKIGVDELKKLLKCDDDPLYQEYKRFNERILKRCHKELLEQTECRFDYEPIRKGRKVSEIQFTVYPIRELEPYTVEEPANMASVGEYLLSATGNDGKPIFAQNDVKSLVEAVKALGVAEEDQISFLAEKVSLMKHYEDLKGKKVYDPYAYIMQAIRNTPKGSSKKKLSQPEELKKSMDDMQKVLAMMEKKHAEQDPNVNHGRSEIHFPEKWSDLYNQYTNHQITLTELCEKTQRKPAAILHLVTEWRKLQGIDPDAK